VISNYISQEDCEKFMDQAWAIIETLSLRRIERSDRSTQERHENYFPMVRGGMIPYIGHSQLQWDLRKECRSIFE